MTLHAHVFPQGTRVVVRKGHLPMDERLPGRRGTVVSVDDYRPGRYAVLLDGDAEAREFAGDELASGDD